MIVDGQTDFLELLLGGKCADNPVGTDGDIQFFIPRERDNDQQLDLEFADEIPVESFLADLSEKLMHEDTDMGQPTIIIEDASDPNLSAEVPTASSTTSSFDDNIFTFELHDDTHSLRTLSESTDADSVYSYLESSNQFSPTSSFCPSPATPDSASTVGANTPKDLIKESLKLKLKAKRRMEGKEDIKIEFVPPPPEQLTNEELEQRQLKREKNKLAAQKCRSKKRERAEVLEEQTRILQAQQDASKLEIQKLVDERDRLRDILNVHGAVCPAIMAAFAAI